MSATLALVVFLVVAALYDFVNGFHDGGNIVATLIASRAMGSRGALAMAAAATFAGPFVFGTAVAHTIGAEVLLPEAVTFTVALAALGGAGLWNLLTWWVGVPVSSSHALVGGLVGAAFVAAGSEAVQPAGLAKVATALFLSPILGFVVAIAGMHGLMWLLRDAKPRANLALSRAQLFTASALALANGANDAQKTVGMIALGLLLLGFTSTFTVPWWAIALSAGSLALGMMVGGGRIVKTLGARFYRIRPIHAFTSQVTSAALILGASLVGGPVSSTQVVGMTIVGAGAAERRSQVRWAVVGEIALAWLLTIPASALLASGLLRLVQALAGER
jgi:PiT family inorganic phosphate transporter